MQTETPEDHLFLDGMGFDRADQAQVANDLVERDGAAIVEELKKSAYPGITLACAMWKFGSEAEQILEAMGDRKVEAAMTRFLTRLEQ